jgi:dTDP-4-amino-4,6-dideoxygalactose transaminase|tara:strand:+ start:218 stop:1480 length:1263 start_codon:yes stop_codon:yes gene_type:complete
METSKKINQKMLRRPLVIEGGEKSFNKPLNPAGSFPESVKKNVESVLNKGRLFRYDVKIPEESEVSLLEKEFAEYIGSKHSIAFNSCSSSIFVALKCAGVQPNNKVFMPAFTFAAVPSAIHHAYAHPLMIETQDDYCVDISDFKKKITDYPDIKVFLLSHMRGHVSDMDAIIELCSDNDIFLIEDAAHALGTQWEGKKVGVFGQAGCFSAQSYKMIDGGEGGFLVTDNDEIAAKAILYAGSYERAWKSHFHNDNTFLPKLQKEIPPYNFRMTNLTASIIRPQISLIDERKLKYNKNYCQLVNIISESQNIKVPDWDNRFEYVADSIQFNLIDLSIKQKSLFMDITHQEGIPISIFGLDNDNARCFWNWNFLENRQRLDKTKKILESACDMRLPLYLEPGDIELMGYAILRAINYAVKNSD